MSRLVQIYIQTTTEVSVALISISVTILATENSAKVKMLSNSNVQTVSKQCGLKLNDALDSTAVEIDFIYNII